MFIAGPKCEVVLCTRIPIINQVGRPIKMHLRYLTNLVRSVNNAKKLPLAIEFSFESAALAALYIPDSLTPILMIRRSNPMAPPI